MAALEQMLAIHIAGSRSRQQHTHHFSALIGAALQALAASEGRIDAGLPAISPEALACLEKIAEALHANDVETGLAAIEAFKKTENGRLATAISDLLAARAGFSGLPGFALSRQHTSQPPDKDYALAAGAGALAGLTIWLASLAALGSAWHFAPLAALGVGNFAILLASMERPHILAPKILLGVSLGVIAATVFRLFVLPHASNTADVLLMVIPFMILGAFLRANPRTSLPAVDYNMCFLLAGQPFLPAETSVSIILQGGAALMIGCALVALIHLCLPRKPAPEIRKLTHLIVRDLECLATMAGTPADPSWQARMGQRLVRLSIHLSRIENLQTNRPDMVLAALNLAHALISLHTSRQNPAISVSEQQQLHTLIEHFGTLASAPERIAITLTSLDIDGSDPAVNKDLRVLKAAFSRFQPLLQV
jgi:hypothetical protein